MVAWQVLRVSPRAEDTHALQVSTANLERVRKVKTRHQRLMTRVVTVREELQRFLEDDDDMMKMCLTRKRTLEHATSSSGELGKASSTLYPKAFLAPTCALVTNVIPIPDTYASCGWQKVAPCV